MLAISPAEQLRRAKARYDLRAAFNLTPKAVSFIRGERQLSSLARYAREQVISDSSSVREYDFDQTPFSDFYDAVYFSPALHYMIDLAEESSGGRESRFCSHDDTLARGASPQFSGPAIAAEPSSSNSAELPGEPPGSPAASADASNPSPDSSENGAIDEIGKTFKRLPSLFARSGLLRFLDRYRDLLEENGMLPELLNFLNPPKEFYVEFVYQATFAFTTDPVLASHLEFLGFGSQGEVQNISAGLAKSSSFSLVSLACGERALPSPSLSASSSHELGSFHFRDAEGHSVTPESYGGEQPEISSSDVLRALYFLGRTAVQERDLPTEFYSGRYQYVNLTAKMLQLSSVRSGKSSPVGATGSSQGMRAELRPGPLTEIAATNSLNLSGSLAVSELPKSVGGPRASGSALTSVRPRVIDPQTVQKLSKAALRYLLALGFLSFAVGTTTELPHLFLQGIRGDAVFAHVFNLLSLFYVLLISLILVFTSQHRTRALLILKVCCWFSLFSSLALGICAASLFVTSTALFSATRILLAAAVILSQVLGRFSVLSVYVAVMKNAFGVFGGNYSYYALLALVLGVSEHCGHFVTAVAGALAAPQYPLPSPGTPPPLLAWVPCTLAVCLGAIASCCSLGIVYALAETDPAEIVNGLEGALLHSRSRNLLAGIRTLLAELHQGGSSSRREAATSAGRTYAGGQTLSMATAEGEATATGGFAANCQSSALANTSADSSIVVATSASSGASGAVGMVGSLMPPSSSQRLTRKLAQEANREGFDTRLRSVTVESLDVYNDRDRNVSLPEGHEAGLSVVIRELRKQNKYSLAFLALYGLISSLTAVHAAAMTTPAGAAGTARGESSLHAYASVAVSYLCGALTALIFSLSYLHKSRTDRVLLSSKRQLYYSLIVSFSLLFPLSLASSVMRLVAPRTGAAGVATLALLYLCGAAACIPAALTGIYTVSSVYPRVVLSCRPQERSRAVWYLYTVYLSGLFVGFAVSPISIASGPVGQLVSGVLLSCASAAFSALMLFRAKSVELSEAIDAENEANEALRVNGSVLGPEAETSITGSVLSAPESPSPTASPSHPHLPERADSRKSLRKASNFSLMPALSFPRLPKDASWAGGCTPSATDSPASTGESKDSKGLSPVSWGTGGSKSPSASPEATTERLSYPPTPIGRPPALPLFKRTVSVEELDMSGLELIPPPVVPGSLSHEALVTPVRPAVRSAAHMTPSLLRAPKVSPRPHSTIERPSPPLATLGARPKSSTTAGPGLHVSKDLVIPLQEANRMPWSLASTGTRQGRAHWE